MRGIIGPNFAKKVEYDNDCQFSGVGALFGGGNSPFCVRDINGGAVAWVYYRGEEWKSNKGAVAIHAGCNPAEFMEKVRQIQDAVGPWEPEDEEE